MSIKDLQNEIRELKEKTDVSILAHYYQNIEIQEIADYLGDSLGLSRTAKEKANTEYIIFAGVVFMAESASILNQDKHILVPAKEAHCPLANFLNPDIVSEYRKKYPELPVITYVNSTAAVKAESDICCTSSNSIDIVKKMQEEFNVDKVLFGPDNNLAEYAEEHSGVKVIKIPEKGHCYVHSHLSVNMLEDCKNEHPSSEVLVHPECTKEVRHYADYVGSTAGMYNYVKEGSKSQNEFIIGTEKGLLDRLSADFPQKDFHLPSEKLICKDMKKNKLKTIKDILLDIQSGKNVDEFEIKVPEDIAKRALTPIEKMLEYSN